MNEDEVSAKSNKVNFLLNLKQLRNE